MVPARRLRGSSRLQLPGAPGLGRLPCGRVSPGEHGAPGTPSAQCGESWDSRRSAAGLVLFRWNLPDRELRPPRPAHLSWVCGWGSVRLKLLRSLSQDGDPRDDCPAAGLPSASAGVDPPSATPGLPPWEP